MADVDGTAELNHVAPAVHEVLQFRDYSRSFYREMMEGLSRDDGGVSIRYIGVLPNGREMTIDTVMVNNLAEDAKGFPGTYLYLVAQDKGDVVGLTHVLVHDTPVGVALSVELPDATAYEAKERIVHELGPDALEKRMVSRNFHVRDKGIGIGRLMSDASDDWLRRFAQYLERDFVELLVNKNLADVFEASSHKYAKEIILSKIEEQRRFQTLWGETEGGFNVRRISPQKEPYAKPIDEIDEIRMWRPEGERHYKAGMLSTYTSDDKRQVKRADVTRAVETLK